MTLTDLATIIGLTPAAVRDELVRLGLDAGTIAALSDGSLSLDDAGKLMQYFQPPRYQKIVEMAWALEDILTRLDALEHAEHRADVPCVMVHEAS
jgi:hypothetical protein